MIIKNALVYGTDLHFHRSDIYVTGRVISSVRPASYQMDEETIDATGCYAIPGLIDIHFHGALGYDVCDATPEAFEKIAVYEAANGITTICPATLTLPVEELCNALSIGADFFDGQKRGKYLTSAHLAGFNMEGPFISYVKRGAQNADYILPCSEHALDRFISASNGLVKFIGLAPEANSDFESYIRKARNRVTVSLAHTDADYEVSLRALQAGASHVVHLYNAMRDMTHRDPGPLAAVMDYIRNGQGDELTCELICDGIHVHPAAVRAAFDLLGPEHIILISDSLRSTGMPDGQYTMGGKRIQKEGKYCRLCDEGNIAGSVSNLLDCLRTVVKQMKVPVETAIACATIQPARKIGIDGDRGSIEPGKLADVVLLDAQTLSLRAVIKEGLQQRLQAPDFSQG